jgi:hypothetical protein
VNTRLRMKFLLAGVLAVLMSMAVATSSHARTSTVVFTPSDALRNDRVGWSVAVDDGAMVIGTAYGDVSSTVVDTGSAYIFRYDPATAAWDQGSKVTATNAAGLDLFGYSVAANGQLVVIGAPYRDASTTLQNNGAVYLFSYHSDSATWVQEAMVTAADGGATNDRFGTSVAMSRDVLVVGAPYVNASTTVTSTGAAYVFRVSFNQAAQTWTCTQEAKLTVSNANKGDQFGGSVAVNGDTIVVGAPGANAVYVYGFDGSTWVQEGTPLTGGSTAAGDRFGASVAFSGDALAVGAPADDDACVGDSSCDSGAVYVFRGTQANQTWTWVQEAKLGGANPDVTVQAGDQLGFALALSGPTLAVGAPGKSGGTTPGYADLFRYDETSKQWKPAPNPKVTLGTGAAAQDQLGYSVALNENRLLVGAPGFDIRDPAGNILTMNVGVVAEVTLNRPPIANAGADQAVQEGSTVILDGSASNDPDGDALTYQWMQTAGQAVTLDDPANSNPTFVAPSVPPEGAAFTFQLTVNDGEETSEPAYVTVTVTKPADPKCEVSSSLGRNPHPGCADRDLFTFQGNKGEKVTLTLQADETGKHTGKRAMLVLQDRIRGSRLFKASRGALPAQVQATLPATGKYLVTVMDDPSNGRNGKSLGNYTVTLEGAANCLEPVHRRPDDPGKKGNPPGHGKDRR